MILRSYILRGQNSEKLRWIQLFILSALFILVITIFQDYLQSVRNNFSFYFSESLLFKSFWLLFYPVAFLLVTKINKITSNRKSFYTKAFIFIIIASGLHIILYSLTVLLLSALFFDHTYSFNHTFTYTISEDVYKYILIYGSIAFIFLKEKKTQLKASVINERLTRSLTYINKIIVTTGKVNTVINIDDIFTISTADPYIAIHTENKKHLHAKTLKSLGEILDPNQFERVHRSTIVNLQKVLSYKSRLNGDYDILLKNKQEVRLSRNYVEAFKKGFEKKPSV